MFEAQYVYFILMNSLTYVSKHLFNLIVLPLFHLEPLVLYHTGSGLK